LIGRIPDNCPYTAIGRTGSEKEGNLENPTLHGTTYFNSGLLILQPSEETLAQLKDALNSARSLETYKFPDQDFLNEFYRGRWIRLSYAYNALKTLRSAHPQMWNDKEIRIVHYILGKPQVGTVGRRGTDQGSLLRGHELVVPGISGNAQ
jgi:lipopolysaccharide biosynthesis glycosyltransferase